MATFADKLVPHLGRIRAPGHADKVYKDECVFSFDTPESEGGLYVCLNTFLGFSKKFVERRYAKTGDAVYLHLKTIKKEVTDDRPAAKRAAPTKLAIGLEGGFDVDLGKKYEYEHHNSLVILPNFDSVPLPNTQLPEAVQLSVAAVLAADSASVVNELEAMAGTWDGEKRVPSKHSDTLVQLDNGVKVAPTGWKCERCDLTENLWLNLTDGAILCGRKYHEGSGGNNHSLEHFKNTGYPLVVKLGTITPEGADVHSYDEDDMVIDTNLAKHLEHFGIEISKMKKTDKTMLELEIDLNQRVGEWAVIQEAGSKLTPLFGPGYTGLANLGNSCYLNSVVQVVMSIPEFQHKYYDDANQIFDSSPPDPAENFTVQMTKLAVGILSGDYSKEPPCEGSGQSDPKEQEGIKPLMFKTLVGRNHPEFSTKRQQDAQEFFLYFLELVERNCRNEMNPADCLKFEVEERILCTESGKVRYTKRTDWLLPLPVPLECALNKQDVDAYESKKEELLKNNEKIDPETIVRSKIPLSACLDAFAKTEKVSDFFSTAVNKKVTVEKTTRLRTFPDYLMIQLKKFALGQNWIPKKLDVEMLMPHQLDLSFLRGSGVQPGEELLPEPKETNEGSTQTVELNQAWVSQLADMGFPLEGCKKAVFFTQNTSIEAATEWAMDHMNDPDFGAPFVQPGTFQADAEALETITNMGFSQDQALKALKATDNNVQRAMDWIFSRADDIQAESQEVAMETDCAGPRIKDGPGNYQLVAFISHMGESTMVGHYVCHIFKDGRWVIFNDNKVALSENPPKEFGYLYLYRRVPDS
ncbi:ubiquitin carboxyl-terminal hydrolase 5 isoform X1 [Rhipicephalus sanguineus]|uniref:ubiquitin carboxyl-terminal hydrolase 5 isoform X1 n=1 Tax=Rhipicephalus sanguineus TaxID=34632 RepID=UPI0020C1DB25|nr:ubiquitin carboxyl-terminal hydrolase 5 isoform X1 [Rhipicephalus sanguineus]